MKKIMKKIGEIARKADEGKEIDIIKAYALLLGALIVFTALFLLIFSLFSKPNEEVLKLCIIIISAILIIVYLIAKYNKFG